MTLTQPGTRMVDIARIGVERTVVSSWIKTSKLSELTVSKSAFNKFCAAKIRKSETFSPTQSLKLFKRKIRKSETFLPTETFQKHNSNIRNLPTNCVFSSRKFERWRKSEKLVLKKNVDLPLDQGHGDIY